MTNNFGLLLFCLTVTTTGLASVALSLLQQHKQTFKIVMANFDIPDEAGISLLHNLAEFDVPIICEFLIDLIGCDHIKNFFLQQIMNISSFLIFCTNNHFNHVFMSVYTSNPHKNAVTRALQAGANFLMDMTVSDQNLKYIWQHALRRKSVHRVDDVQICPKRKREYAQNSQDYLETSDGKQAEGITWIDSERNIKRLRTSSTIVNEQVGDDSNPVEETGGGENIPVEGPMEKEADHSVNQKKSRFVWNSKLQQKFTAALSALSDAGYTDSSRHKF